MLRSQTHATILNQLYLYAPIHDYPGGNRLNLTVSFTQTSRLALNLSSPIVSVSQTIDVRDS